MPCWLVAYDIGETKLRNAAVRKLEKLGRRIQKSVFIVECGRGTFARLERELQENLAESDSLLFVSLCARCLNSSMYKGPVPEIMLIY